MVAFIRLPRNFRKLQTQKKVWPAKAIYQHAEGAADQTFNNPSVVRNGHKIVKFCALIAPEFPTF